MVRIETDSETDSGLTLRLGLTDLGGMLTLQSRHRIDIRLRHFAYALSACVWARDPEAIGARLVGAWSPSGQGLACRSVRSGFHLLLDALGLNAGDEVLVSAVTHPDMVRILEAHGLVPVPVDLDIATLAPDVRDFDPHLDPEYVSTGIFNLMVPMRSRAALGRIVMNMVELRKLLGNNGTMAYCFACGENGKAFSRGMLPWELYEDAATGSAAGALGAYLVKHGRLSPAHTLNILQGAEMGRPSHIEVEVTQGGKKLVPRVSGAAVKVFEGTIQI